MSRLLTNVTTLKLLKIDTRRHVVLLKNDLFTPLTTEKVEREGTWLLYLLYIWHLLPLVESLHNKARRTSARTEVLQI